MLNFKDKESTQLTEIKKTRFEDCSLVEIHVQEDQPNLDSLNKLPDIEFPEFKAEIEDFISTFVDLDDFDWKFDENYTDEKRRGGHQRHRQTTEIKEELIQPMFSSRTLIKGKSIKQRAEKINNELSQVPTMSESEIELFSKKYGLKLLALKNATPYFEKDRKEQIYKWCLAESKGNKSEN